MCGICGIALANADACINPDDLRQMTTLLQHRGPDSEGFHLDSAIGLGVRRLSIIDLETGDQPITNESGQIVLVCNGEIYNAKELRQDLRALGHHFRTKSDVEVIVHLYEERGAKCLSELRGMFAFAIWDEPNRTVLLARDRIGIKPLYYSLDRSGSLYFASELKSIVMPNLCERNLDLAAFQDCCSFGFVIGEKTFFKEIRKLLPGHYLTYQNGSLTLAEYWEVDFPSRGEGFEHRTPREWEEGLLDLLQESVKLHLRSDVEVGCLLSAGLDSTVIAALATQTAPGPRLAFSLSFENPDYDEISSSRILSDFPEYQLSSCRVECRDRHFEHLPRELWYQEDPGPAGNWITTSILAKEASQHVKTVLCGEGSDEIFGGYRWFHLCRLLQPFQNLPRPAANLLRFGSILGRSRPWLRSLRQAVGPIDLKRYSYLLGLGHHEMEQVYSTDLKKAILSEQLAPSELPRPEGFESWAPFLQLQYYEMKTRLPNYIIQRLDRASMSHSLEVRVPFLDHRVLEYCCKIPPSLKMSLFLREKAVLRNACARIIPAEIANRRKRGLEAPVNEWFSMPLPDFARCLLSEKQITEKGYFDSGRVEEILQLQRSGQKVHGFILLRVLLIQMWDEIFIRNRDWTSF